MKNTSKLIGILSALIVVILAIFLVTKFNSQESVSYTHLDVYTRQER